MAENKIKNDKNAYSQIREFASGNEMAVMAVKQIGYDIMGYYPITPSTQISEGLDSLRAEGKTDIELIGAEGEHSAAGVCYGASVAGGRVFNATSANGLLYALEQFNVQSGTRYPMVMNVVCRTVSGPLCIKCDHSDIMYMLNSGWIILFASTTQQVYDFNIIAVKLAEKVNLPVVVAYDGFFTSHQKRTCFKFSNDEDVRKFIGEKKAAYPLFDFNHPISVGSYMGENDVMQNRYELHNAMKKADKELTKIFGEFTLISNRTYHKAQEYNTHGAKTIFVILGSAFETAKEAVDILKSRGQSVGAVTLHCLRPFPQEELINIIRDAEHLLVLDRQDSYGAAGGNLSMEVRAVLQKFKCAVNVTSYVYGLGGQDFYVEDVIKIYEKSLEEGNTNINNCDYYGMECSEDNEWDEKYNENKLYGTDNNFYEPVTTEMTAVGATTVTESPQNEKVVTVSGGKLNATAGVPKRLAPGHGACPGCGIIVNLNLLLRAIEEQVVLLFQTGCAMIVTTPYPKTCFKVPYVHNLFQNGAATLSGIVRMFHRKQENGEIPKKDTVFVMVTGDGGMDIGMGCALSTALRGEKLIIFEYDNGGYMNTGYQMSYSTPKGAKSSTSHIGVMQYGKTMPSKDTAGIMAASGMPYVATAAESHPEDFIKKAAKAAYYSKKYGTAYIKALSACPLNWNDNPAKERSVIEAAVNSCYYPLYEVERGITNLTFNPENAGRKIPVADWLAMMGRTKHLQKEEYRDVLNSIQEEVDRKFEIIKEKSKNPLL